MKIDWTTLSEFANVPKEKGKEQKMIYLASPYSHEDPAIMEERFEAACKCCAKYTKEGFVIYSPVVHWHVVAKQYNLPKGHKFWRFHNYRMIHLSSEVWVLKLKAWSFSKGVIDDIAVAKDYPKEVKYIHAS